MNIRRTALSALVLGAAVGAALGVGGVTGAVAHADESNVPFTLDDFNAWPVSVLGYFSQDSTDYETFPSIPLLYNGFEQTYHWQLFDTESHDNLLGAFDSTTTHQEFGGFPFSYQTLSNVVTDSSGTGLPDGTTWDYDSFSLTSLFPVYGAEIFSSQSVSVPDGMTVDFFQFLGVGNEVVTSTEGTTDFLYLFGDFVPIFDMPAA
jgi:hypothetical protein